MNPKYSNPVVLFSTISMFLLLVSVASAIFFDLPENIKKIVFSLWIIIPPLWFWLEYCFLFERGLTQFSNNFEKFKYGQELSRNLWLAISAILLLIYFGKLPGG
jgi:hypothetical protein